MTKERNSFQCFFKSGSLCPDLVWFACLSAPVVQSPDWSWFWSWPWSWCWVWFCVCYLDEEGSVQSLSQVVVAAEQSELLCCTQLPPEHVDLLQLLQLLPGDTQ